jgi:isochorismate synthase
MAAPARDREADASPAPLKTVGSRPELDGWRDSVARLAGAVGRGRLDKAVLARQVEAVAAASIDVPGVLHRLCVSAPESTVFAVYRGGQTFLGATPERLVTRRGREVRTVAMAGSTPRGSDPDADAQLAAELFASDKEREEHAVVVEMLRETLAPLTDGLDIAARPSVLRLRHLQHLVTPVSGRLREPVSVIRLAELLHPTPAVAGSPRDLALELIAEEEPFERGWFAGPLGWVDRFGDGELVVALRSGIVAGRRAMLLAGCGIVADSDPDREWQESESKLQALGSALGGLEP